MIDEITKEMANEEQLRVFNRINDIDRDPKAALLIELEKIVDYEQRMHFEDLREKVLTESIKDINEILNEAEPLVAEDKKNRIVNLKFLFDESKPMQMRLWALAEIQKAESFLANSGFSTQTFTRLGSMDDSYDEETKSPVHKNSILP